MQDCILRLRQKNADVPGWFHYRRRSANEASLQDAADALAREVERPGAWLCCTRTLGTRTKRETAPTKAPYESSKG